MSATEEVCKVDGRVISGSAEDDAPVTCGAATIRVDDDAEDETDGADEAEAVGADEATCWGGAVLLAVGAAMAGGGPTWLVEAATGAVRLALGAPEDSGASGSSASSSLSSPSAASAPTPVGSGESGDDSPPTVEGELNGESGLSGLKVSSAPGAPVMVGVASWRRKTLIGDGRRR